MKTKTTKTARKAQSIATKEEQPVYYVLASSMNEDDDDEKSDPEQDEFGYPDFYEDTDNMNRYLW